MISQSQYDELIKHKELFELVKANYIPSGQNGRVQAVEVIHKEYHKCAPTDMSCDSCVFSMLRRMIDCMRVFEYETTKVETKPKESVNKKTNKNRANS